MEREKIIQYLQGIKCEWFPVEWDSFMVDYIETKEGYDSEDISIKYEFNGNTMNILYYKDTFCSDKNCGMFYYSTIYRCKTLLLNAVRSVDEPKRRGAGINIEGNGHHSGYTLATGGELIQIYYHTKEGATIAWENGEFK